jgi:hypothetical protein
LKPHDSASTSTRSRAPSAPDCALDRVAGFGDVVDGIAIGG